MAVYKRGETWWFKFRVHGQLIRESAKTSSKTLARDAERMRRRELEESVNRIPRRERLPLFSIAAEQWLTSKSSRSKYTQAHYRQYVDSLSLLFGKRLVCDITADDIASLQRRRETEGKSGRTSKCGTWRAASDTQALSALERFGGERRSQVQD